MRAKASSKRRKNAIFMFFFGKRRGTGGMGGDPVRRGEVEVTGQGACPIVSGAEKYGFALISLENNQ